MRKILQILFLLVGGVTFGQIQMSCDSCWCEGTIHFYDIYEGHKPIATNIYDDNYQQSTLDHADDHRAQIFQPSANYSVSRVRLKLQRVGYLLAQDIIVEIREVDDGDNPTGPVLSYGIKRFNELVHLDTITVGWYPIKMNGGTILSGHRYAIIVHLDFADSENKLIWKTNDKGYPYGYAIWTNNGYRETGNWEKNYVSDRLFEIWGKPL